MTMREESPPQSPGYKRPETIDEGTSMTEHTTTTEDTMKTTEEEMSLAITSMLPSLIRDNHPTLPASAIHKSLMYHFPTPPNSPPTSYHRPPPSTRRASFNNALSALSPLSPPSVGLPRRAKHDRTTSRTSNICTSARRRSSSSYGPPLYPAPTTPLPPVPGAPRVPYTTPAQERQRYSAIELFEKLRVLETMQIREATRVKRHSAPAMWRVGGGVESAPSRTIEREGEVVRRVKTVQICGEERRRSYSRRTTGLTGQGTGLGVRP
jgi:hypothetical protein